jgi:hypothetical protein
MRKGRSLVYQVAREAPRHKHIELLGVGSIPSETIILNYNMKGQYNGLF